MMNVWLLTFPMHHGIPTLTSTKQEKIISANYNTKLILNCHHISTNCKNMLTEILK